MKNSKARNLGDTLARMQRDRRVWVCVRVCGGRDEIEFSSSILLIEKFSTVIIDN